MITTAEDMMVAVLHGLNREDAEGLPYDKFNYWVNKAYLDWLTERVNQFDQNQKHIDDIFVLREERVINTNGSRVPVGSISVRILSDNTGTITVDSERYFNVSGLQFVPAQANSGCLTTAQIDSDTGEISDVATGDVFYAIIQYSELDYPVISKVTVTASGTPSTIFHTYTGSALLTGTLMLAAVAAFRTAEVTTYANTWGTLNALLTAAGSALPAFMTLTDYRFLIPNGFPNPKYFRLLNVMFKISYVDNALFADGESTWLRAKIMRADQRDAIMRNPLTRPSDEKPYYRIIGDFAELITDSDSLPLKMKLEYIRYPLEIRYVEPDSGDTAVDCELSPLQQKEIVDLTVRYLIEATKDDRYQTQVAELQLRKPNE